MGQAGNLEWFMNGLFGVNTREYEEKLNHLYFYEVKDAGYKVMRNPAGKHKVQPLL